MPPHLFIDANLFLSLLIFSILTVATSTTNISIEIQSNGNPNYSPSNTNIDNNNNNNNPSSISLSKYHLSTEAIFQQRPVKELKSNYDVRALNQIEKTMQRQEHELAEQLARRCLQKCSIAAYGEAGSMLGDALFEQDKIEESVAMKVLALPYKEPVRGRDLRLEMNQYLLCLFRLGFSEAYQHVFQIVAGHAKWVHPFQISIGAGWIEGIDQGLPLPFYDNQGFKVARQLEDIYPIIYSELSELLNGNKKYEPGIENLFTTHQESHLVGTGEWQEIRLCNMFKGLWSKERCALLPRTCHALQKIAAFTVRIVKNKGPPMRTEGVPGRLSILRLIPGTTLKPHTGAVNMRLSIHMGLNVPPHNASWISCGNVTKHWKAGKSLIFDDSFVHYVGNEHLTKSRIILAGHFFKRDMCVRNKCVIPRVVEYGMLNEAMDSVHDGGNL